MREHQRRRLEKAFHLFDLDQSGSISLSELRDVLQALGCNPTEKEVVQIMAQVQYDCVLAVHTSVHLKWKPSVKH